MEVIRRNTGYALRVMVHLSRQYGAGMVSTRAIAANENFPYPLAAKIMQSLQKAGLVKSSMGVRGGFELAKHPTDISLLNVIVAIQGPVSLIRCVMGTDACCAKKKCSIRNRFCQLQDTMTQQFREISLLELTAKRSKPQAVE